MAGMHEIAVVLTARGAKRRSTVLVDTQEADGFLGGRVNRVPAPSDF